MQRKLDKIEKAHIKNATVAGFYELLGSGDTFMAPCTKESHPPSKQ